MLAISTNSCFLIIPEADHVSLLSHKEYAYAVANAIVKKMVAPGTTGVCNRIYRLVLVQSACAQPIGISLIE